MNRSDSASRAARSHHLCVSNGKCRGRVLQKGTLASMHKADTQGMVRDDRAREETWAARAGLASARCRAGGSPRV